MQQRSIAYILLGTLIIVGIFGFLVMGTMEHSSGVCPLPGMATQDCTLQKDMLTMLQHHITTVQSFMLAVLVAMIVAIRRGVLRIISRYVHEEHSLQYGHRRAWSDNQEERFFQAIRQYRWLARRRTVDFSPSHGCMDI